jgi:metal-responsive CopG/Arc/MetJ family transcriptional regulator
MAKKQFAPPVTNFSVSCDPAMVAWLNEYAHKHRTTRSKIVRKALIDFRAEHKMSDVDENAPVIDVQLRCDECDAAVIRIPGGRNLCTRSSAHMKGD